MSIVRSTLAPLVFLAATACNSILGLTEPERYGDAPEMTSERNGTSSPDEGAANGESSPKTCDADLTKDTNNCGTCGHDCLGGACEAGKCQPVQLATVIGTTFDMAADATALYVSKPDGIFRIMKESGEVKQLTSVPAGENYSTRLMVNGGELYHAGPSGPIKKCFLPCQGSSAVVTADVGSISSIEAVNGYGGTAPIAWLDSTRKVVAVPLDGQAKRVADSRSAGLLHFFGSALYWSEGGGKRFGKLEQGAQASVMFDTAPLVPGDFAVVGDDIFFATTMQIRRGQFGTTTIKNIVEVIKSDDEAFVRVKADGSHVYALGNNALWRIDRDDKRAPEVIMKNRGQGLWDIVVDDRAIYVRDSNDRATSSTFWRLAK